MTCARNAKKKAVGTSGARKTNALLAGRAVGVAGEPRRGVRAQDQLLQATDADLVAAARAHKLLDMERRWVERVEVPYLPHIRPFRVLAAVVAVQPVGVEVSDAFEWEAEERLENEFIRGLAVVALRELRPRDPPRARFERDVVVRAFRVFHLDVRS